MRLPSFPGHRPVIAFLLTTLLPPLVTARAQLQPTTAVATVVDSTNTTHVLYLRIPSVGAVQLTHTFRQGNGTWSPPRIVSTPGSPNLGAQFRTPPQYAMLQEAGGMLHCFFDQTPGVGVMQSWHTTLPVGNPGAAWTAPVDLSRSPQPVWTKAVVRDRTGALHVLYSAIPGTGAAQLFHVRLPAGGAWSTPSLLSSPGSPSLGAWFPTPYNHAMLHEDANGRLHCFFDQAVPNSLAPQTWHRIFDSGNPGAGWTAPVDVSRQPQPVSCLAVLRDSGNRMHVLFHAIPGVGAPQIHHCFLVPGGTWSSPTLISTPGAPLLFAAFPMSPGYAFLQEDASQNLHCFFDQATTPGVRQCWHRRLDLSNLAAGWLPPTSVSRGIQPAKTDAVVLDSSGRLHLLYRAIPAVGAVQLHHACLPAGGTWTTPVIVSTPGSSMHGAAVATMPSYTALREAGTGSERRLHCIFEQTPTFGVIARAAWHTELDITAANPAWSSPVNLSSPHWPAFIRAVAVDDTARLHVLFLGIAGYGATQLFHTHRGSGQGWAAPALISSPGAPLVGARFPLMPSYAFLAADGLGRMQVFFEQVPGTGVSGVFHRQFSLSAPSGGWSAPVILP